MARGYTGGMTTATASRLLTLPGLVFVALLCASGCTSSGSSEGTCEARVQFAHHTYSDVGKVDFTVGKLLGTGRIPQCNDTGGQGKRSEPVEPIPKVFAIKGLDPSVAVAAGDSRSDAEFYALKKGDGHPAAVRKYIESHR